MSASELAEREKVKGDLKACDRAATVCLLVGPAFAVVGIIADAANRALVLEPTSWLLLAVATLLAGIIFPIGWAVSWYLSTIE
jgi:hypothetical protein